MPHCGRSLYTYEDIVMYIILKILSIDPPKKMWILFPLPDANNIVQRPHMDATSFFSKLLKNKCVGLIELSSISLCKLWAFTVSCCTSFISHHFGVTSGVPFPKKPIHYTSIFSATAKHFDPY